jgi:deferrochelatase/peroxidase EfeB
MSEVDYADVQGLVRFGHGPLKSASYFLLRIKDAAAARTWLHAAPVTNAVDSGAPSTAIQIAFSAEGLRSLAVPADLLEGFSSEFLAGMTEGSRSRRLGDVGHNAPENWAWGGSGAPHLLIMFFAKAGNLEAFIQGSTGRAWDEAFDIIRRLDTSDLDEIEPFGFRDGIGQPEIDWWRKRDVTTAQVDYTNNVALGEFLLGYPNEYNKYTERPLIVADAAAAGLLPAEEAPEKKDLGRNGTYLVLRQLRQDVRGFWQFLRRQTGGDDAEAERLASALVGRTPSGDSLVATQERTIPGTAAKPGKIRQNQFTFDQDPLGSRCPFGAHIRRLNPRNSDYPRRPTGLARLLARLGFGPRGFRDDLMSSVRFHRILRRGRKYGPGLSRAEAFAAAPADDPERGLHFICLNANISRQFEFLQNSWVMNPKFSGLSGENDPLLGNRNGIPGCPVTNFTRQQETGLPRRIADLPQFVTVRGGAYFFLPSLRALRYFAKGAGRP